MQGYEGVEEDAKRCWPSGQRGWDAPGSYTRTKRSKPSESGVHSRLAVFGKKTTSDRASAGCFERAMLAFEARTALSTSNSSHLSALHTDTDCSA